MSKERLEEIKELHEQANRAYHEKDFERMGHFLETLFTEEFTDWLIEQAEQVQELEKLVVAYQTELSIKDNANKRIKKQNKRYREALEQVLKEKLSVWGYHQIARKALAE